MPSMRPFRSVLYVPATNERALAKAATLPCDAVILDLEDAVAQDEKARARGIAREVLEMRHFEEKPVIVRVNGFAVDGESADLAEDLAAILPAAPMPCCFRRSVSPPMPCAPSRPWPQALRRMPFACG